MVLLAFEVPKGESRERSASDCARIALGEGERGVMRPDAPEWRSAWSRP